MKITVITVCLNAAATIEETIQSVLGQDYPDIEYIVVDGMSTDGTLDIINKYRDKISLVIREPDEGLYDAMNKGVLRSSGEIINFMNADDYFASLDVLSHLARKFSQHPDKMVIYGDCIATRGQAQVFHEHPQVITRKFFLMSSYFNQQVMFYRRTAFDIVDLFDKSYSIHGDLEWNVRAFLVHELPYLHVPLTVCISKGGGLSCEPAGRIERNAVRKKYFSRAERFYFRAATFTRRLVNRIVTRNFSMPVGVRTFVETRRQNLMLLRRND